MNAEAKAILEFTLVTVSSVFFIVDPFATIPAFVIMTENDSAAKRLRMARQAAWTCFLVLTAFALMGSIIFKIFSITLPAFKIAGGVLLFMVAVDMLQARRSQTQESEEERTAASAKEEVGISPIGIPMLAGPGAISTVMVLMGQSKYWWQAVPVFSAIAATSLIPISSSPARTGFADGWVKSESACWAASWDWCLWPSRFSLF